MLIGAFSKRSKDIMAIISMLRMDLITEIMDRFLLTTKPLHTNLIKDHIWLTEDLIKYFDRKRRSACSESFIETLYLNYKYVDALQNTAAAFGDQLSDEYRRASKHILLELIKRGMYVLYGCEPSSIVRSCFNFIVVINDDLYEQFVEFLKVLYLSGVNVNARRVKNSLVHQEIVFAKDCATTIYTEKYDGKAELPVGFHSHGKPDMSAFNFMYIQTVNPWFGISGCLSYELVAKFTEKTKCRHHSLYVCETWNQTYDSCRVEDIILCNWMKFNGKYGMFNTV